MTVYVEGSGLDGECRRAFQSFFEKAGLAGRLPRVVALGSRNRAFDRFCHELNRQPGQVHILLVDSESAVQVNSLWEHVRNQDRWQRPTGATEDHLFLMVQMMESWLVADATGLIKVFPRGFRADQLPAGGIESRSKHDVLDSLKTATRGCKQPYAKGLMSFRALEAIDPAKVEAACPSAKRLLDHLRRSL